MAQPERERRLWIDPAISTLAGLGMKVGTDVVDYRISRSIGYWTGSGLSENLPAKTAEPQTPRDRAELMAVLEDSPNSPEALDAAQWIILNTQDGAEVEKGRDVILQEHISSPNLVHLAQELERIRHPSCRKLLEAMLEKNPHTEVRGNACLSLATIRKDEAKYGENKPATAEAVVLYERVIADFGNAKRNGSTLADLAKPELSELRRLIIGKQAPETEGPDLDGQPLKLSAYRGKVVVLTFWGACGGCRPDVRELRDLLERLADKPFASVGVYCDDDAAKGKEIVETMGITWPSFHGGRNGPIPTLWNNNSWPSTYVLDRNGVIRFRDVRRWDLAKCVGSLLNE
jgi:peroxiredoxin